MAVDLSILIVTYNRIDLAVNLLHHLSQEPLVHADGRPLTWEWIVVDNNSPRKDPVWVGRLRAFGRDRHPGLFIEHDQNPGYAGGMNLAYARSTGRMILVCNPDMVFGRGAVNRMVAYLEGHPEVGAVGPMGFWDPRFEVCLPPNILPTLRDLIGVTLASCSKWWNRRYSRKRTMAAVPVWTARHPVALPMLSGCCFLMQRSLIEQIGFFDERYPLYYEDTDLFRRIAKAGKSMVMLPDAKLTHFYNQSGSTNEGEAMRRYWISRQKYYEKWYGVVGTLVYRLTRKIAQSGFVKQRLARPMDPIQDLGEVWEPPVLHLPRRCERFVVELAQDPCFLLAGGILGSGDSWRPGDEFWSEGAFSNSTYFFRVHDLSRGVPAYLGTWSFRRVPRPEPLAAAR